MKNRKWIGEIVAALVGIGIYYLWQGPPEKVHHWGIFISVAILVHFAFEGLERIFRRIFRFYPTEHKPVREAYAEYLERKEKERREKLHRRT